MSVLYKLALKLLRWGEARFGTKAELIVTAMTTAPMLTLVPDPLPATMVPRATASTALADYKTAQHAAADGSKAAIKDRGKQRAILAGILTGWAAGLEQLAIQAADITILTKSGFDLRQPIVKPQLNGVPGAPLILVKRGVTSGTAQIRVKPMLKRVDTYEAEYALGDPTVAANYKGRFTSKTGSRILFTDLELAKLHQFRVRGIGSTGPGDWSDPVGIIVT